MPQQPSTAVPARPVRRPLARAAGWSLETVALLLAGPLRTLAFGGAATGSDWRTASHRATGLAPDAGWHRRAARLVCARRRVG